MDKRGEGRPVGRRGGIAPVGQFPLFRLAAMLARQLSTPVAAKIKVMARAHPRFGRAVCMRTGRAFRACELRLQTWSLALRPPRAAPPLSDRAALDCGADILGEIAVFGLAGLIIIFEVNRQANKQEGKDLDEASRWLALLVSLEELQRELALQQLDMDRLQATLRRLGPVQRSNGALGPAVVFPSSIPASPSSSPDTTALAGVHILSSAMTSVGSHSTVGVILSAGNHSFSGVTLSVAAPSSSDVNLSSESHTARPKLVVDAPLSPTVTSSTGVHTSPGLALSAGTVSTSDATLSAGSHSSSSPILLAGTDSSSSDMTSSTGIRTSPDLTLSAGAVSTSDATLSAGSHSSSSPILLAGTDSSSSDMTSSTGIRTSPDLTLSAGAVSLPDATLSAGEYSSPGTTLSPSIHSSPGAPLPAVRSYALEGGSSLTETSAMTGTLSSVCGETLANLPLPGAPQPVDTVLTHPTTPTAPAQPVPPLSSLPTKPASPPPSSQM